EGRGRGRVSGPRLGPPRSTRAAPGVPRRSALPCTSSQLPPERATLQEYGLIQYPQLESGRPLAPGSFFREQVTRALRGVIDEILLSVPGVSLVSKGLQKVIQSPS